MYNLLADHHVYKMSGTRGAASFLQQQLTSYTDSSTKDRHVSKLLQLQDPYRLLACEHVRRRITNRDNNNAASMLSNGHKHGTTACSAVYLNVSTVAGNRVSTNKRLSGHKTVTAMIVCNRNLLYWPQTAGTLTAHYVNDPHITNCRTNWTRARIIMVLARTDRSWSLTVQPKLYLSFKYFSNTASGPDTYQADHHVVELS